MRLLLLALVLVAACSSGGSGGAGGGSANAGGTAGGSAGGDGGGSGGTGGSAGGMMPVSCEGDTTCNTLVPDGGFVLPITDGGSVIPTPLGGTLMNGTYNLTALNVYGGTAGEGARISLQVMNGTLQSVSVSSTADGGCRYDRQTATLSFDGGPMFRFAPTCPPSSALDAPYTANSGTFKLYAGTTEQVFTRQP